MINTSLIQKEADSRYSNDEPLQKSAFMDGAEWMASTQVGLIVPANSGQPVPKIPYHPQPQGTAHAQTVAEFNQLRDAQLGTAHTQGEWRFSKIYGRFAIHSIYGENIGNTYTEVNAQRIVTAVNSFDDMLEALKRIEDFDAYLTPEIYKIKLIAKVAYNKATNQQ